MITNGSERRADPGIPGWKCPSNSLCPLCPQLNHVFQSSAALGRYFNQSRTGTLSVCLHFHMPVDSARLVNFTLSLEMVSNVLLQHLYDRGFEEADRLKLDPASLSMEDLLKHFKVT
uniref:Uncharacterized protein n=1 Tax=Denticeps clupeoides TaxID=299321 RepID=A0AAY4CCR1_9TELE